VLLQIIVLLNQIYILHIAIVDRSRFKRRTNKRIRGGNEMAQKTKAIVIGTGVGGLSAAAYLGRLGFDVMALEQAEEPGGLLCPHRFGEYQFNWAVHYVGMCRPGQMLHRHYPNWT
jgi:hypothetical protein